MADTTITEALWTRILEALALPGDTDVETVVTAIEDLATTPPATEADPTKVAAAAGLTVLDPATLKQLQEDAQQGRTLAAASAKRAAADTVDTAIRAGKIPPARREHWLSLVGADPTMGATLASMPEGLVPLVEAGHAQDELVETADWIRP